jgi:hypothetical protein
MIWLMRLLQRELLFCDIASDHLLDRGFRYLPRTIAYKRPSWSRRRLIDAMCASPARSASSDVWTEL